MLVKKSLLTTVATAFLLGISITGSGTSTVIAATEQQYPQQQIMREIGDKYKVGEILSEEDAKLLKKHAIHVSEAQSFADAQPDNWTITGSNKNSTFTGALSGTVYVGLNLWENNFSGTITTYAQKGTPTHYKNSVQMEAYGPVGAGGTKIIKVADFTVTNDWTKSSKMMYSYTFDQPFNAAVTYYYVTPKGAIKNDSGSLEIIGVGKKK